MGFYSWTKHFIQQNQRHFSDTCTSLCLVQEMSELFQLEHLPLCQEQFSFRTATGIPSLQPRPSHRQPTQSSRPPPRNPSPERMRRPSSRICPARSRSPRPLPAPPPPDRAPSCRCRRTLIVGSVSGSTPLAGLLSYCPHWRTSSHHLHCSAPVTMLMFHGEVY